MEGLALQSPQKNEMPTFAPPPKASPGLEAAREQVVRILASDTLRASEAVRRLFRFLADKAFAGEADQLKEYSIGVDGLGKPTTFDPRHDAAVRLLASRLRLKLDEYYSSEGRNDLVAIEMPKGRFRIIWKSRSGEITPVPAIPLPGVDIPPSVDSARPLETIQVKPWRVLAIGLAILCFVLILLTAWSFFRLSRTLAVEAAISRSSPELETLWGHFISSPNHVVIAFWNPLFMRLQRNGKPDVLYRRSETEGWDDLVGTPEYFNLKRLLGNPTVKPTLNYTMRGSLVSIFALSQFFGSRRSDVSLTRLDELSWQQVADNDVVLIAPSNEIYRRQSALPVLPAFIVEKTGIRNLRPVSGELPWYDDLDDPQQSDGETVELISMMPGPLGRTRVVSFAGNHSSGLIGSVQSLTDPAFARVLVAKLKEATGKIPSFFQIIIKVRYRDDTPTYTSYVTHRALTLKQNSPNN
jgi:hypothetical protein